MRPSDTLKHCCGGCARVSCEMLGMMEYGILFPVVFCNLKSEYFIFNNPSCEMFEDKKK